MVDNSYHGLPRRAGSHEHTAVLGYIVSSKAPRPNKEKFCFTTPVKLKCNTPKLGQLR